MPLTRTVTAGTKTVTTTQSRTTRTITKTATVNGTYFTPTAGPRSDEILPRDLDTTLNLPGDSTLAAEDEPEVEGFDPSAREMLPRNPCPTCPSGVIALSTASSDSTYCCVPRRTVTKSVIHTITSTRFLTTLSKTVTSTRTVVPKVQTIAGTIMSGTTPYSFARVRLVLLYGPATGLTKRAPSSNQTSIVLSHGWTNGRFSIARSCIGQSRLSHCHFYLHHSHRTRTVSMLCQLGHHFKLGPS